MTPRRRRVAALAVVAALVRACFPLPAGAEPAPCVSPVLQACCAAQPARPCTTSRSLRTGDPAPCDGVLAPTRRVVQAARCAQVDLPTCRNDAELGAETCAARLEFAQSKIDALDDALETQRRLTREALSLAQPALSPAWYESPSLWAGVGFVVGVAATVGVARALR